MSKILKNDKMMYKGNYHVNFYSQIERIILNRKILYRIFRFFQ